MKLIVSLLSLALLVACVPAKKYNELVEKEKKFTLQKEEKL